MKSIILAFTILFMLSVRPAAAIYDPLSVPNNRIGVHILAPDELEEAGRLVNNDNKGAWGYVTVPIQATDRDREKWTTFMKRAAELRLIPLIRVATYGYGDHWIKPQDNDLIDFANFLNDLPWPIENRYVIIFNEVNRADEYGGQVSPEAYADILNNAIDIFKSRSDKFFILPSALDNAAPNGGNFMRWDIYLTRMYQHNSEVFHRIDGWNSHAYGNPAFSASPAISGYNKADSFKSDLAFLNQFTKKKLPVFVTEAGWSNLKLDDRTIATYFNHALYNIWSNDQVVAVTPFLLFAGAPPFDQFSLLTKDRQKTLAYQTIQSYATHGEPLIQIYESPTPSPTPEIISQLTPAIAESAVLGKATESEAQVTIWKKIADFIKNLFQFDPFSQAVVVADKTFQVEIVSSDRDLAVGLSKYEKLEDGKGMLFKLPNRYQANFWMKDMKFDIDIVWVDNDVVVGISQGYKDNQLGIIPAPAPVTHVLEVNLNSGISVGDTVKID